MMHTFRYSIFISAMAALMLNSSCASDNDNKVNLVPKTETTEDLIVPDMPEVEMTTEKLNNKGVAGVYVGKLPCPDCQVIEYRLELQENGNYSDLVFHKGKDSEPSQSIGQYTITNNNLINLGKFVKGMNVFAKTDAGLLVLNDDGNRITGGDEKRYQLLPESTIPKKEQSTNDQYFADGIGFYVSDAKSTWRMELVNQEGYRFYLANNEMLTFDHAEPEIISDYIFKYNCAGNGGSLTLTLDFTSRCQNNTTGDLLDCAVTAEIKRTNGKKELLSGCGNFTTYPDFFETTWQLSSINKAPANVAKYEGGLPTIKFGKGQRDFRGLDGCNEIAGQYYLLGDKLNFNQFASTAMSCPNMAASREFDFAIQGNMYSFVLYDGQLTFTNLKNTLVFTKK